MVKVFSQNGSSKLKAEQRSNPGCEARRKKVKVQPNKNSTSLNHHRTCKKTGESKVLCLDKLSTHIEKIVSENKWETIHSFKYKNLKT